MVIFALRQLLMFDNGCMHVYNFARTCFLLIYAYNCANAIVVFIDTFNCPDEHISLTFTSMSPDKQHPWCD